MFNNYRGAWSVHRPDSIVLGVMNLLDRKELLVSVKESLPTLTCGPVSKVFGIFGAVFFFNEKLNFRQLVRLQFKLRFCYSPHRSVAYISMSRAICFMETLGFLCTRFFRDGPTIP
ncbi:uncharacterized protein TNCV_4910951 [Trichonephila clavipes]|nr:uncharacterized protein TNCV_4910951 [Trichonephila clavipes]